MSGNPVNGTFSELQSVNYGVPQGSIISPLQQLLEKLDAGDIWRIQNPNVRDFTWSRTGKLARLDYLFTPQSFLGHIRAYHLATFAISNHRMVTIVVRPCVRPRGPGFWKFKASLLHRQDFCDKIGEAIERAERDSKDLPLDVRWEFLKLKIRETSISFAKQLREEQSGMEAE